MSKDIKTLSRFIDEHAKLSLHQISVFHGNDSVTKLNQSKDKILHFVKQLIEEAKEPLKWKL